MIQIKVAKKINNYQEKFFGLNAKHLLVAFIVFLLGVPVTLKLSMYIGKASLIPTMIIAIITAVTIMFKHNELTAIQSVKKVIKINANIGSLDFKVISGLVKTENGVYTKLYEVQDVNYETLSEDERNAFYQNYFTFLNSLSIDTNNQVSIISRRKPISNDIFIEDTSINNELVKAHNDHVRKRTKEIYTSRIIISVSSKFSNEDIAVSYFDNLSNTITDIFKGINVRKDEIINIKELKSKSEINKVLEVNKRINKVGYSNIEFIGNLYSKSFALEALPSVVNDSIIKQMKELPCEYNMAIKFKPFDPETGIKEIKNVLFAVESDKRAHEKKFPKEKLPDDIIEKIEASNSLLESLRDGNQQLFRTKVIITLYCNTLDALTKDSSKVKSIFSRNMYKLTELTLQMKEAYIETLPLAIDHGIKVRNTLLTEGLATFMPFTYYSHPIEKGGTFYGINTLTKEAIVIDKTKGLNYNSFILATSGAGKSFFAKYDLLQNYIGTCNDIVIIDPEGEYVDLVEELGGQVIDISNHSNHYINLLEIPFGMNDYTEVVKEKLPLVLVALEAVIGEKLTAPEKSSINKVLLDVYQEFMAEGKTPILQDIVKPLYRISNKNKSKDEIESATHETQRLHHALEMYTYMSMDLFNHHTNIGINQRLTLFRIGNVSGELKKIAMVIILDYIWNKVVENQRQNKFTNIYIDEIYLLFQDTNVTQQLMVYYKRFRKYGGIPTGITQNIEDLLESDDARKMLSNSYYLILLDQAKSDRREIVKMLGLSEKEEKHITNVKRGHGLLKVGGHYMPFENIIDHSNKLFVLFSSTLGQ